MYVLDIHRWGHVYVRYIIYGSCIWYIIIYKIMYMVDIYIWVMYMIDISRDINHLRGHYIVGLSSTGSLYGRSVIHGAIHEAFI